MSDPQPTVVFGPCGERHAVDRRVLDVETTSYRHSPEIRHAARTNFLKIHRREITSEEDIEESALGVTVWALADIRDWSAIDIGESMILGGPGINNCINIEHEPRTATPDAVDMMRQSRRRRMRLDSLGAQTVLPEAIGALDSVVGKVEALILPVSTDDDEDDILGVDAWVDSEIEITLDSGC